ncbi:hypothetical protein [Solibacillus sp. FSL K6-1523]|uniref:hypothetical protein n=1 Tax=Solibacillus sp. FSL K6-1523 TaxID=2921471 RepID=UPI0040469011
MDGSNGAFNPNVSLTRAQLAKILVLAFSITPSGTSTFQDVPKTHLFKLSNSLYNIF